MHAFSRNFVNKIPKILLLMLVLYALSLNRGMLFGHSAEPVTADAPTPFDPAMAGDFFKSPVTLSTEDSVLYEVRFEAANADPDGYVIVGNRETNSGRGFGGSVPVAVFLDDGMIIRGVRLLENSETPRFLRRLEEERFLERWNGRHLYDPLQQIDASSGATYTSRAVVSNVNNTLAALLDRKPAPLSWNRFVTNYLGEFAILFVAVMSLACFISPQSTRQIRIPLLLLSVVVLGIWQGAFVSLALLYKWLIFGTSPLVRFGIFIVVLLALLLPLLTNKAFYCTYLCPFGAAQELAGRLWPGKRAIPKPVLHIARWVRQGILAAAVILLLTLPHFEMADIEPFTAFLIRSASASALILAGLSLVASLFFQRPWCRLLCPTGELLSILRRPVRYPKFLSHRSGR
ncbi:MAG: 4Fe-4S binding protein [Rikenellaceae bacterium]|nr:4Fe-4S binding protein [Rikenellaceae bacterium]